MILKYTMAYFSLIEISSGSMAFNNKHYNTKTIKINL